MTCETDLVKSPITVPCLTPVFGIPYATPGRIVANNPDYGVQGIIIHCYDGTINQLCNQLKCASKKSVITGSIHGSFHYGIGVSGHIQQFVDDQNISWGLGTYKSNVYTTTTPAPNEAISWPLLQGVNGLNVTPDAYVLNLAITFGQLILDPNTGCFECQTASGLPENQHQELVQLLAFLAQEHSIPIDVDHISFHDLISCDAESNECPCLDLDTLLQEVTDYCPPCEAELPNYPDAAVGDTVTHIIGATEPCCVNDSIGCVVKVPFDACWVGDLAVEDTIVDALLGVNVNLDGQYCLTRGCLGIDPVTPLTGCGTGNDPLGLDLCAWGAYIPDQAAATVVNLVATDIAGCLIESSAIDVIQLFETPVSVVDTSCINLTTSGISDHTIQADIIISGCVGNLITCEGDGLCVQVECADLISLFNVGTIVNLHGDDGAGACIVQPVTDVVNDAICAIAQDMAAVPTWILGQTLSECPVFVTPASIVAAGLEVTDTDTVDLTLIANNLSADVIVDPAADNILIATANGVYVPDLTVLDSDCLDLTYAGRQLTITPIISPAIGGISNVMTCEPTGFYVPRGADALVNGPLVGNGSDTNPLDIDFTLLDAQDLCDFGGALPLGVLVEVVGRDGAGCLRAQAGADVIAEFLVANDTDCIDLTLTGNVLTAAPILDPDITNQLLCNANGLFAPASPTTLTVVDTDCVDLDITLDVLSAQLIFAGTQGIIPNVAVCIPGQGFYVPQLAGLLVSDTQCISLTLAGDTLTATPVIDPDPDNTLSCGVNGLFVSAQSVINVSDTDCLNLDLTLGVISGTITLAGAQGGVNNAITCIPGIGLYAPEDFITTALSTDCIDLQVVNGIFTASPIISADCGNGVECRADGLYVNNEIETTGIVNGIPEQPMFGFSTSGAVAFTEIGNDVTVQVDNPSTCNPMIVHYDINGLAFNAINETGDDGVLLDAGYAVSVNGGPLIFATSLTSIQETPLGRFVHFPAQSNGDPFVIVPPGGSYSLRVQPVVRAEFGTGTFTGFLEIQAVSIAISGHNYID